MKLNELQNLLKKLSEPDFRFRQIVRNYYSGRFKSFEQMTDLPKSLRSYLQQHLSLLSVEEKQISQSVHTQKALLQLSDSHTIESVLMDYDDWLTACLSSQVGCPLGCKFCATGQMGFIRNLTVEEIIDQILFWKHYISPLSKGEAHAPAGERDLAVRRVVFMGMGEPFLNWDSLLGAIKIINSKDGLNIGQRKISISTAGIVPKIKEFADLDSEINLAISLHSLDQKIRQSIMPIAKQYPLNLLKSACLYYINRTHRQLFFEYSLIKNVNDRPADLNLLVPFLSSHHLFFLNLIPLNPIAGGFPPSSSSTTNSFVSQLRQHHINFSLRRSFGQKIHAACGQLANQS